MSDPLLDIDELMNEAAVHAKAEIGRNNLKRMKRAGETPEARDVKQLYQNPDNWERTRGIALIHRDSQTLLGNFSEYVHKTVPGCRKLLREDTLMSVAAVEQVEGSWWLSDLRKPEPQQEWHVRRPAIVHVHLPKLKVHSPACEVIACLSYGSITRVELAADTQLAQEDTAQEQMLFLPAGTDILGEMSQDSKIALRVDLALEEK